MMSNSGVSDRIIDPMMAIANCSTRQRIVVVGAKSMELVIELHRRGYLLAAAAGNCGRPAGQYEVALVDWRRRTLHALDATVDWLDDFLSPRAVLVIWLDAQKAAAKDTLRAAVTKRGFVVLQGAEHPCGSVLLARRSEAIPFGRPREHPPELMDLIRCQNRKFDVPSFASGWLSRRRSEAPPSRPAPLHGAPSKDIACHAAGERRTP